MNEGAAAVAAAVVAAAASLWAAWKTVRTNEKVEALKADVQREVAALRPGQELLIEYDKTLRAHRLSWYEWLMRELKPLAMYPEAAELTERDVGDTARGLRDWYFRGGGLYLTGTTKSRFFDLQDGLKIVLRKYRGEWSPAGIDPGDAKQLAQYLRRPEGYAVPEQVVRIAASPVKAGEPVPEDVFWLLQALGSTLRTGLTEDTLSRKESHLTATDRGG